MAQNARQAAMNGFREGRYDILVATDIAARGIDVSEITHVINFDMPDTVEAYTHRIGRTGRAAQTGEAFTFTTPVDELLVRDIERVLKTPLERRRLTGFDYGSFAVESRPKSVQPAPMRSRNPMPVNPPRSNSVTRQSTASHNRTNGEAATGQSARTNNINRRRRRFAFVGSR